MDETKDIISIIKDLLQIIILLLTAAKLIKDDKGKSKKKRK